MKKAISLLCVFALILALAVPALADVDLSGLSFEELVALKSQIDLELFARPEWQSVEVPQGLYLVGRDIPAGKWSVKAIDTSWTHISVGQSLKDGGMELTYPYKADETIYGTRSNMYSADKRADMTIEITDGDYVQVAYGTAVFEPFHGTSLGFK